MSLKQIATDVLNLIDSGKYTANGLNVSIQTEVQAAIAGSRLYAPAELKTLREKPVTGEPPDIEVIDGTTQQVAQSIAAERSVTLLNFASARNPGGGFLNGAKAQEEDLCRCSAIYPTLVKHQQYYDANRKQSSLLYTDYVIHSPNVPFFRTRGTGELLDKPFAASVITAPAPNTKPYLAKSGDPALLKQCFERRWRNILAVARNTGVSTILLGAWGCGAFGGDPVVASQTARRALLDMGPAFQRVVFAIPGKGRQSQHNLSVFAQTFDAKLKPQDIDAIT